MSTLYAAQKGQLNRQGTHIPQCAVLVVESNALLNLCMVDLVETAGFKTLAASNARDALDILEDRADVSLVLTNVLMPGNMDGLELAHLVDNRWPSVKVIVVSGKVGVSEVDLPSSSLFFSKPYHGEEILFEIRSLTGH